MGQIKRISNMTTAIRGGYVYGKWKSKIHFREKGIQGMF